MSEPALRLFHAGDDGEPTVRALVEAFLADQVDQLKPQTLADRKRICTAFVEAFGDCRPSTLRPSEVKRWITGRPQWKADNTRWCAVLILKRLFNWAIEDRWIGTNPIKGLKLKKGNPRRATGEDEFQVMLRHSDSHFRRLLVFLRLAGCRPGEAAVVDWEMIDWAQSVIVIPPGKHKTGAKTGKPRLVALSDPAKKLLGWMGRRVLIQAGPIFRNSRGRRWTRVAMGQRLKQIRAASGLSEQATLHGIRHLVGTTLVKRGVPLKVVAQFLGHNRVATTEEYYCHVHGDAAFLRQAADESSRRDLGKRPEPPAPPAT